MPFVVIYFISVLAALWNAAQPQSGEALLRDMPAFGEVGDHLNNNRAAELLAKINKDISAFSSLPASRQRRSLVEFLQDSLRWTEDNPLSKGRGWPVGSYEFDLCKLDVIALAKGLPPTYTTVAMSSTFASSI